jgi:hypothetical protein
LECGRSWVEQKTILLVFLWSVVDLGSGGTEDYIIGIFVECGRSWVGWNRRLYYWYFLWSVVDLGSGGTEDYIIGIFVECGRSWVEQKTTGVYYCYFCGVW